MDRIDLSGYSINKQDFINILDAIRGEVGEELSKKDCQIIGKTIRLQEERILNIKEVILEWISQEKNELGNMLVDGGGDIDTEYDVEDAIRAQVLQSFEDLISHLFSPNSEPPIDN